MVIANDLVTVPGDLGAELVRPQDSLIHRSHDEQDRWTVGIAERFGPQFKVY